MSLFDARFYDFLVHSPENADSITGLSFEAKRYGYSGIAICSSKISNQDLVHRPEGFLIYHSIEISTKSGKLRDEIRKQRESQNILIVRGRDEVHNREAVEAEGLDILLQPAKFNNVLAKTAFDNSITLGFNICPVIRLRGEPRARELKIMKTNLMYARKYTLRMILTGDVHSYYDLRSPREMAAISGLFGMTAREAADALSLTPEWILKRKSPGYIQEGIEIL